MGFYSQWGGSGILELLATKVTYNLKYFFVKKRGNVVSNSNSRVSRGTLLIDLPGISFPSWATASAAGFP